MVAVVAGCNATGLKTTNQAAGRVLKGGSLAGFATLISPYSWDNQNR
jgi:enterochelin esterase-like enzyme